MLKVGKCIQVNVFGASPKPDRECVKPKPRFTMEQKPLNVFMLLM